LTKLEAEILGSVKAMVDDIEVLDKQIDEMHQLLGQLMFGTRKAVGVAWSAHRTRVWGCTRWLTGKALQNALWSG